MQIENICINCMQEKANPNDPCPHCGFDSRTYCMSSNHLPPFTILNGKYLLGRVVGEGGFGIVYIAKDLYLNITVAVKELFLSQQMTRLQDGYTNTVTVSNTIANGYIEEIKNKFIQEARTIAQLQATAKEGVTNVKDFFEENGTAYMVMEYLDGGTLKDYLHKNEKIEFMQVVEMLKPVLSSLKKIHDAGIIHRDISPDNIMLLSNGEVKLIDFGGVKDVHRSRVKSEVIQVKKGYTPIEQYQVEGHVGPWTDIYALCATIYRCITGKLLPEPMEIMKEGVTPPSQLGVKIPKKAEAALMKGLQIDYTKRTQDIQELYNAFYSQDGSSGTNLSNTKGKKLAIGGIVLAVVAAGTFWGFRLMNSNPFDTKQAGTVVKGLEGFYEINSSLGENLCWTVNNDYFSNAELIVSENQALKNQCFEIISVGEDSYNILNKNTGLALTVEENPILGSTKVVQSELTDSKEQEWQIIHEGETDSYLFNIELSDGSIAYAKIEESISGEYIKLEKYDKENIQEFQWNMANISNDSVENRNTQYEVGSLIEVPDNIYTLQNNGEVLGVEGNFTNDGCIVRTNADENHNFQKICIVKGEDEFYILYAAHSNSMISTLAEDVGAGAGLVQWAGIIDNGNQKYEFVYCDIDKVIIRNQNGLCIGRGTDDSQVRLYEFDLNNPEIVWEIKVTEKNASDEMAQFKEPPLGSIVDVTEGTYFIQAQQNQNIMVGVDGGYSDDGMVLKCIEYSEKNSNRFFLVKRENGLYSLDAAHTNMYVCADDNGILHQYSEETIGGKENAGVWELLYAGQNAYFIRNVINGKCLGTVNGTAEAGAEAVLVDYDTENASTYWTLQWTEKDPNEAEPVTMFAANTPVGSVIDLTEGTYMIQSSADDNILLGMEEGYADDGMALMQVSYEERNSNKFYWLRGTGDYSNLYALIATHSDKYIAPDENGILRQYSDGTDAEKYRWQMAFSGTEGVYYIQDNSQNYIGSFNGLGQDIPMELIPIDSANSSLYWKMIWTEKNELEREPEMKEAEKAIGEQVWIEEGCYSIFSSLDQSMVLSAAGGYWDDGTEIVCSENAGLNSQKLFVVNDAASGMYSLFAAHSNKRIIPGVFSDAVCQYYQEEATGSSLWNLLYAGPGCYFIINNEGYCLDLADDVAAVGKRIILSPYNPEDAGQKWFIQWSEFNSEEVTIPVYEGDFVQMGNSIYEFSSLKNPDSCWAVSQGENSGQLISWERVYDTTQQFYFEEAEPFTDDVNQKKYRIISVDSGKCLTLVEDGTISFIDWNGGSNQLWQVVYGGFGTYCIRSEDNRFITSWDGAFSNGGALCAKGYEEVESETLKWFMTNVG